jgi:RimJ/RimL family protein N-acetyltransferase
VRQRSFNSKPITEDNHRRWFYRRLRNCDRSKTYIVETQDGLPVGVVRFDDTGSGWEIGISIDAAARGRRLGASVLESAMADMRDLLPRASLIGRVKHENTQSQALFESLGFLREVADGWVVYRCTL